MHPPGLQDRRACIDVLAADKNSVCTLFTKVQSLVLQMNTPSISPCTRTGGTPCLLRLGGVRAHAVLVDARDHSHAYTKSEGLQHAHMQNRQHTETQLVACLCSCTWTRALPMQLIRGERARHCMVPSALLACWH